MSLLGVLNLEKLITWTEITRPDEDRCGHRYASSSTDEEWALVSPFMPPVSKLGRPHRTDRRAVWGVILCMETRINPFSLTDLDPLAE